MKKHPTYLILESKDHPDYEIETHLPCRCGHELYDHYANPHRLVEHLSKGGSYVVIASACKQINPKNKKHCRCDLYEEMDSFEYVKWRHSRKAR